MTSDNEILSVTTENLGSLLSPKRKAQFQDPLLPFSGLHGAMNMIGKIMQIDFKFVSETLNATPVEDAIDRICRMSGVDYRSIRVETLLYNASPIPLLAFYGKEQTPVVLELKTEGCFCHDPATGKTFALKPEEAAQLGPFAYQFYRSLTQEGDLTFFKMLKKMVKFHIRDAAVALAAGFLFTLFALFTPFAIKWLFDTVLPSGSLSFLFQLSLGVAVALLATALFMMVQRYTISRLRSMVVHDLQLGIWGKVFHSSSKILRKFSVGEIFEKIDYFSRTQQLLGEQAVTSLINLFYSLFYLGVMLYFSWPFTLGALVIIVVSFLLLLGIINIFIRIERRLLPLDNKLVSKVVQFIRGIRTIRVTNSEDRFFASWANSFIPTQRLQKEMGITRTAFTCLVQATPMLITLMIYIMAVVRLEQGETTIFNMTIGDYMAFVYALNSFVQSTFGVFGYYFELMTITPTWNQAKEILEVPPESTYVANSLTPLKGEIALDHVDFAYQEDRPILRGIDLTIKPGEFVGIVGPTGCGKSTLIRLLLGLEVPSKGTVRYDGKELSEWDLKDLRGQIGCVLQNTTIFEGSILENILAGRRIDEKKIAEVIKMAGIAEFIEELPMGLHTGLSYGGTTISLGQKQRILIARALVNDPKVILFDEATSALDNESQKIISDNLADRKVTRIVVAHRPVTLKHADRIFIIQDGRLK